MTSGLQLLNTDCPSSGTIYFRHFKQEHITVCTKIMLLFTGFVAIGTVFDIAVWYYAKNLKIFDEEVELKEVEQTQEKIVVED